VSELVYTLPGFWVVGSGSVAKVVSMRSASMGGSCQANIVIDNMPDQRINDVPASQVAAIEAYAKGGGPLQFQQPCGLIMIWTKR
jgi:hypothetical protein